MLAGFYLHPASQPLALHSEAYHLCERKFNDAGTLMQIGNFHGKYYHKIKGTSNHNGNRHKNAFVFGSLIYKCKKDGAALDAFLDDYQIGSIQIDSLFGSYCIMYENDDKLNILVDPSSIYNIYYAGKGEIITSSFLAAMKGIGRSAVNKFALAETLLSGTLAGHDTIFEGAKKIARTYSVTTPALSAQVISGNWKLERQYASYSDAVNGQIEVLDHYFSQLKKASGNDKFDSGITSGFDSRLILAFLERQQFNYQLHTHYRKHGSIEVEIGKKLAATVKKDIVSDKVPYPEDLAEDQLLQQIEKGKIFTDGQLRMHGYWWEKYNTSDLRLLTLRECNAGLSGIAGEQYRNGELIPPSGINLRNYIKYNLLLNISGSVIKDTSFLNGLIDYMEHNTKALMGFDKPKASMAIIKRYYNDVVVQGRLGGRNNSENTISAFYTPFTEFFVAQSAYNAAGFLKRSYEFQAEMIARLSPSLASISSDYGFAFNEVPAAKFTVKSIIKNIIPNSVTQLRLDKMVAAKTTRNWYEDNATLKGYFDMLKEVDLPINFDLLKKRDDVAPLIYQAGILLKEFMA